MKSNFHSDLSKEKQLDPLLDSYYKKHLKRYWFERATTLDQQFMGIDLILTDKRTGAIYFVDEKAQLDYVNESLPTFAFELFYEKNGKHKQGWLFNPSKKTQFYALATSIYADDLNTFTSCNITFVNRKKLIAFLDAKKISAKFMRELADKHETYHGKLQLNALDIENEGYLYFSKRNKAEKPTNLILRLEFLINIGVAKKLI